MLLANQFAGFLNQICPEKKINEIAWFFACRYKFMEIKSSLKNIGMDVAKNRCEHPSAGTLKL